MLCSLSECCTNKHNNDWDEVGQSTLKGLHFNSVCTQAAWWDKSTLSLRMGDISNRMCLDESGGIRQVVLLAAVLCWCSIYSPPGPSSCALSDSVLFLGPWKRPQAMTLCPVFWYLEGLGGSNYSVFLRKWYQKKSSHLLNFWPSKYYKWNLFYTLKDSGVHSLSGTIGGLVVNLDTLVPDLFYSQFPRVQRCPNFDSPPELQAYV